MKNLFTLALLSVAALAATSCNSCCNGPQKCADNCCCDGGNYGYHDHHDFDGGSDEGYYYH